MKLSDPSPLLVLILLALYTLLSNLKATNIIGYQHTSPAGCETDQQTYIENTVNANYQQKQQEQLCKGYDGILFISHVIRTAGAGTLFFMSLVDALLYAEHYNLYPFLHINDDRNKPCYDINFHGKGKNITFHHLSGEITNTRGKGNMTCWNKHKTRTFKKPGPPDTSSLAVQEYTLMGNGLWGSYFEPVSPYPFDDFSCREKPMFQLSEAQVYTFMHRCSELAVRSWPFYGVPEALVPQNGSSVHEWLWENRKRASDVVQRHFKLLPWLEELVNKANPKPGRCMAAHVRLTDKDTSAVRDKKGLDAYYPYLEAYHRATRKDGSPIYIATDDARVFDTIEKEWPKDMSARVIKQEGVMRSESDTPTFKILQGDKHRSNTEALVEMYAMSRCSFFVHGFSGMAEAAVYINPKLHERSVNIDDEGRLTPEEFGGIVENVIKGKLEMPTTW